MALAYRLTCIFGAAGRVRDPGPRLALRRDAADCSRPASPVSAQPRTVETASASRTRPLRGAVRASSRWCLLDRDRCRVSPWDGAAVLAEEDSGGTVVGQGGLSCDVRPALFGAQDPWWSLRSVAQNPGDTALILIEVSRSSGA